MKYHYFVYYEAFPTPVQKMTGMTEAVLAAPVTTWEHVIDLKKYIEAELSNPNVAVAVVICNYQLLRAEEN